MISLGLNGNRFSVELDPKHQYYDRARIVVRGLLSSYEYSEDKFTISYDDIGILRHKLDMLGLVEDRVVTPEAMNRIEWLYGIQCKNEEVKAGLYNEDTLKRLEGKLKPGTVLFEDQVTAVSFILNNNRVGIFDGMGFGKTIQILASMSLLEIKRALVICPMSVMIGFEREILKRTYLKPILVPSGREKVFEFIKTNRKGDWNVLLINPENLIGTASKASKITPLLKDMPWDHIVIDEFHMYKNWKAKRSNSIVSLVNETRNEYKKRPRVAVLTGTPVSENPSSAYIVLRLLSGGGIPHPIRFENYFCIKEKKTMYKKGSKKSDNEKVEFKKIVGFKNLGELKQMIDRVSIRRTKANAKGFPQEMPPIIRDVIISGSQLKLYKAICGEIVRDLPHSSRVNLHSFLTNNTRVLRLRQLLNHPSLLEEPGDSAKYIELDSILEEILSDEEQKVVVWTEWRKSVDLLYDRYNDLYGVAKIYGGVDNEQLSDIREKFENEERPRIIVSIPAKGGTGIDFLARARTAIYMERPYSYILYNQSLDRIVRRVSGDTELDRIRAKPATLIFLDVVNSVDGLIRDELWSKVNFVDAVTIKDETLIELGKSDLLRYLR